MGRGRKPYWAKPNMLNPFRARHDDLNDLPSPPPQVLDGGEEYYQQLMQGLPAAIYVCDLQGRVKLYNEAAAELWGRRPEVGRDLWCGSMRIFLPDGSPLPLDHCPMALALKEKRQVRGYEIVIERPDGSRRNVLPFPQPIVDRSGKVVGAVNMLVDVTEMKKAETALREAKESANRSKDRFLAVLSHELRTPLTPVAMAAAAIAGNPDLPAELREEVEIIRRNIDRETRLIDELLDLSRLQSGKLRLQLQSLNLNDAVKNVCEACRTKILEKRIRLHCRWGAEVNEIQADPGRLRQVLTNVLENAAKFTPEGGDIYVGTEKADGRMRVKIRDTGIGIAPTMLPAVFDAFEQCGSEIARQFGGLGLGLAIAKALVELHHGEIRVTSDGVGKGCAVTIELPEWVEKMDSGQSKKRAEAGEDSEALRLLLVEDHADTARMLGKLLNSAGYKVRMAHNAAGALELASKEPFDLLVSDIGLPDASGYHVMQQIKQQYGISGIAMSGYGMDEDIRKSQEAGFSDHLVKPISFARLEEAIRKLARG